MVTFGGCAKQDVLTDKETKMIAQYVSDVVLKRDRNYDQALLDYSYYEKAMVEEENSEDITQPKVQQVVDKKPVAAKEKTVTDDTKTPKKKEANAKINEIIPIAPLDIEYASYKMYQTYPDKKTQDYFTMNAREGYQLMVVNFRIKNSTQNAHKVNLLKDEIQYQLDINTGTVYKPLMTLLVDDLQFMNTKIGAKQTENAHLVFEVPTDTKISDANLFVIKDDKVSILTMK